LAKVWMTSCFRSIRKQRIEWSVVQGALISFNNGWARSGREAYAGGAHNASARDCRCSFVRHNRRSSGTTIRVARAIVRGDPSNFLSENQCRPSGVRPEGNDHYFSPSSLAACSPDLLRREEDPAISRSVVG
jgi:hypothetical protein